jgi:hypothetical protein
MVFLEPKFAVGQTVFWPGRESVKESAQCPDCLGSAKWKVTTPAGTEFEVPCGRCNSWGRDIPKHEITRVIPKVHSMTITAIQAETGSEYGGSQYNKNEALLRYTANGHSWMKEDMFFASHEEAESAAKAMAEEEETRLLSKDDSEKERRRLSEYTIVEAVAENLKKKERGAHYKYERAIDKIKELPDDYVSGFGDYMRSGSSMDTSALRCVARHLLDDLKEDHPEEWGCD